MIGQTRCLVACAFALLILAVQANSVQNIALGKNAYQSTQWSNCVPSLAVNGAPAKHDECSNLNSTDKQYSHTEEDVNQWWRVDLGKAYYIYHISICNRGGTFNIRLREIFILSSNNTQIVSDPNRVAGSEWIDRLYKENQLPDYTPIKFHPPFYARHVAVFGTVDDGITLREVWINGFTVKDQNDVTITMSAVVSTFDISLTVWVSGISETAFEFPIKAHISRETTVFDLEITENDVSEPITFKDIELNHSTNYRYNVELLTNGGASFKNESKEFTTKVFTCTNPGSLIIDDSEINQQIVNTGGRHMVQAKLSWIAPDDGCQGYYPSTLRYAITINGIAYPLTNPLDLLEVTLTLQPFTNYRVGIRIANHQNLTTNTVVLVRTIETAPDGGPEDVSMYPYNTSCVSVKWKTPPAVPNGIISQYNLTCYSADDKSDIQRAKFGPTLPVSDLSCGYRAGSLVYCEVYARTRAEKPSPPTKANSTTQYQIEKPDEDAEDVREVARGSSGYFEIPVPELDMAGIATAGLNIIEYHVIVSEVKTPATNRKKRQTAACSKPNIDRDRAKPDTFDPLLPYGEAADCDLDYYLAAIVPAANVTQGYKFPVGDGETYGGVENVPLNGGSRYSVFYGVALEAPDTKVVVVQVHRRGSKPFTAVATNSNTTPQELSGMETTAIAVGVSLACVITTVIVVTILLVRRRRIAKGQQQATSHSSTANDYSNPPEVSLRPTSTFTNGSTRNGSKNRQSEKFRNVKGDYENCPTAPSPTREESEAIPVDKLKWYTESNQELILNQFEKLKDVPVGETTAAYLPENKPKCRYKDLYPVDEYRVLLQRLPSQGTDFINASHIMGYSKDNKYIAAQGPTNVTLQDFWLMIWQQEVLSIVMATRTFEANKMKCVQYWPDPDEKEQNVGEFHIINAGQEQCPDYIVTQLIVRKGVEQKMLTHYQFISWPDHDVPDTSQPFLSFYNTMKLQSSVKPGPILLHCSAGVGRTGAIIALDYLLDQAKAESKVDIYKCVEKMRERRPNMIQTPEQYVFVHKVLYDAISVDGFLTLIDMFPSKIDNDLLLRREYQYIQETLSTVKTNTESGSLPENSPMNRDPDILPDDKYRIYLNSSDGQTYINAIRVNGYSKVDQFYATQIPLEHTIKDFWQLAHERSCNIIVQLGDTPDNMVFYSPKPGTGYYYGANNTHTITTKSLHERSGLHVYQLEHAVEKKNIMKEPRVYQETREICLIKLPQKFCSRSQIKPMYVISIAEQIVKMSEKSADVNVLVTSSDGAMLCGLFICAFNCLESIRLTQDVEVYGQVLMARGRRKEFVSTRDEYKHIYQILGAYVEQFSQYQNVSSL